MQFSHEISVFKQKISLDRHGPIPVLEYLNDLWWLGTE